ncbi:MAG: cytochrome d ubiquinol oxidase subunit II [Burkholderiales bacterium]|nr:cytochrome d ubiquinol oxidase subunit II [Burkholderiales bacterium]
MIFDYETLKVIWWALIGVLFIGFAVTDGFDMGVGMLLPFLGRTDAERRVIINTIGATWEGNQTWLITAAGATFAAWPLVYAVSFSGMYVAMLLVLFALFFRPVGFDYRSKLADPRWRGAWDWALFAGSAVPALVFGVAVGNLLVGVPFHFDDTMRSFYTGSFWSLLNPFALLAGVVSVSMLVLHGSVYLQNRTTGAIQARAAVATLAAAALLVACLALAGWIVAGMDGYRIAKMGAAGGTALPLTKTVVAAPGAWLANYGIYPWTQLAPVAAVAGALLAALLSRLGWLRLAFVASGIAVAAVILTAGCAMFPFILPSSSHPSHSLTAWDAVSSHLTLQIMFWVVLVFVPLIMIYTGWVYRVLRGKITEETIAADNKTMY